MKPTATTAERAPPPRTDRGEITGYPRLPAVTAQEDGHDDPLDKSTGWNGTFLWANRIADEPHTNRPAYRERRHAGLGG
ncbi:MAG: hypothetical protein AMXMBFR77_07550 [Phycisphaerales bacterium]|nr:MAG: hypothetical protein BroJett004_01300 [Planctomycetota bacterium]